MRDIVVENFTIGRNHKPFIIAEMSGNHNQSLERALEIVEAAAKAGAHALKIQTYTADTMTLNIENPIFKLTIRIVCGMAKISINYINRPILHGSGINRYLTEQ